MKIDFAVESDIERTPRIMQLEGSFDCPLQQKLTHRWAGDVPFEDKPWNIGAIIGPSGSGKTRVMQQMFGEPTTFDWRAKSVVDDFQPGLPIGDITSACSAVGFNSIPSWAKPFANGGRFSDAPNSRQSSFGWSMRRGEFSLHFTI